MSKVRRMSKQQYIEQLLDNTKQHWPDIFDSTLESVLRLHRSHDYLHQDLAPLLHRYHLQDADFGVLMTLRQSKPPHCLSPTEIYHSLLFSSGGLTKVLNRVSNAALIERPDNPEDKRSKLVRLTPKGKALIENIAFELHQHERRLFSRLSDNEQQQLNELLAKLLANWE
jgi:DNA-binding MarR family transcriptional regulator